VSKAGPIAVAAGSGAEAGPKSPEDVAAEVVELSARWDGPTTLTLLLEIAEGFHLNAHPSGEGLIPTEVEVDGAVIKSVDYPAGEEKTFPFADVAIPVYEKQVELPVHFAEEPSGRLTVSIVYQACDDSACLPAVRKAAVIET